MVLANMSNNAVLVGDLVKHRRMEYLGYGVIIERSKWFGDPDYFWISFSDEEHWCHVSTLEVL